MKQTITTAVAASALAVVWAVPATAAPGNGNTETITVDCPAPYGTLDITSVVRGRDGEGQGSTGFGPNGEVYVLKTLEFQADVTATLLDANGDPAADPVLTIDQGNESRGAQGVQRHTQLITCTESGEFTEAFVIDEDVADYLNGVFPTTFDWADHVGETVRIAGTFDVTFNVMAPGH